MEKTKLNHLEEQFIKEAGHFTLHFDAGGIPYAVGAQGKSNLFTMEVEEYQNQDGTSNYHLVQPES